MNEEQFDPLEDRFRQAAEQFEPPYDPQDWMAMENLLDGKKRKKRVFPFWWITDALMVGMAFLFIYQANKNWDNSENTVVKPHPVEANTQLPIGEMKKEKETINLSGATQEEKNNHAFLQNNKRELSSIPVNQSNQNNLLALRPQREKPKTKAIKNHELVASHSVVSGLTRKNSGKTIQLFQEPESLIHKTMATDTQNKGSENIHSADSLESAQYVKGNIKASDFSQNPVFSDSGKVQINQTEGTAMKADTVPETKSKTAFASKSRKGQFFVSASFGLEKSGVKESSLGPSGNVFGGFAGYQWHKDWSVKLGVLFTDKNYSGGSGIYKVPPGSYYSEITRFRAICNIIEVPLMVSYQFKHGKKSNWLLSAGPVTSIMKKEEYHYNYISNSGSTGYGKKYYSTNEVDWFSGFRISPIYQHFFGSKFSLSGEPFIQLPLSGVGQGSVKLYSLGFQLNTSIHLGLKRKH